MAKRVKTASLLMLVFTFLALWIAFVNAPDEGQQVNWPGSWLPPLAATVLLMGVSFVAGLLVRSDRELAAMALSRRPAMTVRMLFAAFLAKEGSLPPGLAAKGEPGMREPVGAER